MIKHLKNNEIDREKWDECISESPERNYFGYSFFLDIMCENSWEALVLNDYEAVLPLPTKRKLFLNIVPFVFFAPQLGLYSKSGFSSQIMNDFLEKLPQKFHIFFMNLNTLWEENKYDKKRNRSYFLSLNRDYDSLYSSFSKNTKRNISKSKSYELKISHGGKIENLIEIFRTSFYGKQANYSQMDYENLWKLSKKSLKNGSSDLIFAKNEKDEILAGIFVVFDKKNFYLLFSGMNDEGREKGAMFALLNYFFEKNSNRDIQFLFCGSNNDNLARFYSSFGADAKYYSEIRFAKKGSILAKLAYKFRYKNL